MRGLVVKNTGSWYTVKTETNQIVSCKVKGNFRLRDIKSTNPVVIGDWVEIDLLAGESAFICEIEDRKNYIVRRSSNLSKQSHILAANLDLAVLIVTVAFPETSTTFIDRFIASAEAYGVKTMLVFNKIDLLDADQLAYLDTLDHLYRHLGYATISVSAKSGVGIDDLRTSISGLTTLFSGHSGVGKSSVINAIMPDVNLRVGDISSIHQMGMHTTTFSEMVEIPNGGYLIDTPGIKGFGVFDFDRTQVSHYFVDLFQIGKSCRYSDCMHLSEPHCAVRQAVEEQRISQSRYTSYLSILREEKEEKYR